MPETASWGGHKFTVNAKVIRGFTGLSVKGGLETEAVDANGQEYVTRKKGKALDVGMTAELHAATGCNVRDEAFSFIAQARDGKRDFLYIGGTKIAACQMYLTEASAEEIVIAPGGAWISAKVKLTFQQASQNDGSLYTPPAGAAGVGGGGGKASIKPEVAKAMKAISDFQNSMKPSWSAGGVFKSIVLKPGDKPTVAAVVKPAVNKAVNAINAIVKDTKKASPPKKN